MKRVLLFVVVGIAVLATLGGAVAYAQDTSIVNIPFKFTVNKQTMMPGKYEVRVQDATVIAVVPEKGQPVLTPTITRLAQQQTLRDATLVFDRVGDAYYLSEVWMPTMDGYLITDTRQAHQHHVIKGTKK